MNRCVIFGNPIEHSQSPAIHHSFAKENGIELDYQLVCAPLDDLEGTVREWQKRGIIGANVTVPFKEEVMQLCDLLSVEAQAAQAVNTLRFREGIIEGHNTDGIGLIADITEKKGYQLKGKRVLLLGAGGATRGVLRPLLAHAPSEVIISNRTHKRAEQLVKEFSPYGTLSAIEWGELSEPFDIIINATSASLTGEFPALPEGVIASNTVGFDLVYADRPTVFMEYLTERGAKATHDGMGMLIEQAVYGFEFWFGIRPDSSSIYQMMRG